MLYWTTARDFLELKRWSWMKCDSCDRLAILWLQKTKCCDEQRFFKAWRNCYCHYCLYKTQFQDISFINILYEKGISDFLFTHNRNDNWLIDHNNILNIVLGKIFLLYRFLSCYTKYPLQKKFWYDEGEENRPQPKLKCLKFRNVTFLL